MRHVRGVSLLTMMLLTVHWAVHATTTYSVLAAHAKRMPTVQFGSQAVHVCSAGWQVTDGLLLLFCSSQRQLAM